MGRRLIQGVALGAVTAVCIFFATVGTEPAAAAGLDLNGFITACAADPVVVEAPGLEPGSKVTAKAYCECIGGKYRENKVSQQEVDLLTKVHKDTLTDEDAAKYPKFEDLLTANEGYEDSCKKTLGLPDIDEEDIPDDQEQPDDEDTAPPKGQ